MYKNAIKICYQTLELCQIKYVGKNVKSTYSGFESIFDDSSLSGK